MSLGAAIVTRLEAVSGVTDLVGTGDDARIYPVKLPQNVTLEAISYRIITDVQEHAMGSDVGVSHARLSVDCWGNDYDEAVALALATHAALSRFSGTSNGVAIQDIRSLNGREGLQVFEDEVEEFRVIQDFMIDYDE